MKNKDIILSTGKICPRCGCNSLEEDYGEETVMFDKNYICIVGCGMSFALNRLKTGKIQIRYNFPNEEYLVKRFGFITESEKAIYKGKYNEEII